jgi:ribosomal protein S18 acetylase RimI-like enzyme
MPPIRYDDSVRPEDFLALGQRVWPGEFGLAEATNALTRTTNIGAWDGDKLVGSVRLLTDGYFLATVSEILVDPAYRRQGIGRELMRRVVAAAPRGRLFLGAQPDAVEFFDRIGCERRLVGFVATHPLSGDISTTPAANGETVG